MGQYLLKNSNGGFSSSNHKTFQLLTEDDINELPGLEQCSIGSEAYLVTDDGNFKVWILNDEGIWCNI